LGYPFLDVRPTDSKTDVMRKITKKIFVHISQTDNIIILSMSLLKHMLKILAILLSRVLKNQVGKIGIQ
jgi:DNA integrity scanning protein DisA with diadenylate cyclase activity